MNKAILKQFLALPMPEAEKDKLMTIGMDWIGTIGYMFAVKRFEDVYVARTLHTLATPTYADELPSFLETLDHLYAWRNHHLHIKDIIFQAHDKREKERLFSSILGSSIAATNTTNTSPNIYLTPTKSRRKIVEADIIGQDQEESTDEFEEF